ncbi:MAG: GTPase [Alphaproteobacteria bacterium]|nr:GTPase [Alphaproteobacteria bacterium]
MRLKTFYAKTMTEAMQMVRDALGEEAVIVATREEKTGKKITGISVTAAIDPSPSHGPAFEVSKTSIPAGTDDWLQYDGEEDDEFAVSDALTELLLRHGVPEDVMDPILSCTSVLGLEAPEVLLNAAIEHLFSFRPLPQKAYIKPLMLMGPSGSGKTLIAAKIAARGVMHGLRVAAISCDAQRAGGYEQLAAFTRLLDVPLHKAQDATALRATLEKLRGYDQIIIDTAGINPFDTQDIKHTARIAGAAEAEAALILPAGLDAQESADIARIFATIGAQSLIAARVDMARRMGGLLAAAHNANLSFADYSNTAKVAEGLAPMSPEALTSLLVPRVRSAPARQPAKSRMHS